MRLSAILDLWINGLSRERRIRWGKAIAPLIYSEGVHRIVYVADHSSYFDVNDLVGTVFARRYNVNSGYITYDRGELYYIWKETFDD